MCNRIGSAIFVRKRSFYSTDRLSSAPHSPSQSNYCWSLKPNFLSYEFFILLFTSLLGILKYDYDILQEKHDKLLFENNDIKNQISEIKKVEPTIGSEDSQKLDSNNRFDSYNINEIMFKYEALELMLK
jgi:hypothetical protein